MHSWECHQSLPRWHLKPSQMGGITVESMPSGVHNLRQKKHVESRDSHPNRDVQPACSRTWCGGHWTYVQCSVVLLLSPHSVLFSVLLFFSWCYQPHPNQQKNEWIHNCCSDLSATDHLRLKSTPLSTSSSPLLVIKWMALRALRQTCCNGIWLMVQSL